MMKLRPKGAESSQPRACALGCLRCGVIGSNYLITFNHINIKLHLTNPP